MQCKGTENESVILDNFDRNRETELFGEEEKLIPPL